MTKRVSRRVFLKRAGQAGALAMAGRYLPAAAIATGVTGSVETTEGPVRGLIDDDVYSFLGVPYAAPPLGKLRFLPPAPALQRRGVLDAIHLGHSAMQLLTGASSVTFPGDVGPALSQLYDTRGDLLTQSEDCLVLNIWAPRPSHSKRPVMVWFHGGGFNYGSGSWPAYNGHNLAKHHEVVVVTVNHRLNAFGFLNLADIAGDAFRDSGIAGQLDLVKALEWIGNNIANFGGDPGNITIFGQSGGGAKVSILHNMPHAQGLFHRCIIESGAALRVGEPTQATQTAEKILRVLGLANEDIARLQALPAAQIQAAAMQVGGRFGPILNTQHIPEMPFSPDARPPAHNIPVMVGTTKDEATLYNVGFEWWRDLTEKGLEQRIAAQRGENHAKLLIDAYRKFDRDYSPRYLYSAIESGRAFEASVTLAERKMAQQSGNVYLYVFAWDAPVDDGILKAPHTIEIPFVFDNVEKGPMLLGERGATRRLGDVMSEVWTQFAHTGEPRTLHIPRWRPYELSRRPTMVFNNRSRLVDNYMGDILPLLRLANPA